MRSSNSSDDALSGLNAREVEILRLLTAGHTAKTIAVHLGTSETAINERLRAARRKTGIGSSRELARLLDARKNRDRNIDLPAPAFPGNALAGPRLVGPVWSKGMIAMLVAMSVAAAALVATASPSSKGAAEPHLAHAADSRPLPLVGTWSLDVSRIPEAERPRGVTIGFQASPDGKWTTLVEIVAPDGSIQRAESTAALDGVPVPVRGNMDFIDTVALRQPAPNTLVMTLGKDGAPVSTRVYAVSRDRRTMTETIVWAGRELPNLETTYFNRIN
jgi:DNA-binding CsgD family transcriptional regulator